MKKFLLSFLIIGVIISFSSTSHSASKRSAKKMVYKAVKFYKIKGKTKTLKALSKKNGKFHKGSLYVFAWDMKGVIIAHPVNHGLIGRNVYNLKDPDGVLFVKNAVSIAKSKGSGWVKYKWSHPKTKKVQKKMTYVKKVDGIIFACGIYR